MKKLLPIFLLIIFSCKNDPKKEVIDESDHPSNKITNPNRVSDKDLDQQQKFFDLKREQLVSKKDQRSEMDNLVISKSILKETEEYVMDFEYPYLNPELDLKYDNFNKYIDKHYLDTKEIERQIKEEKRLCDSLGVPKDTERRIIEYKIYNLNDQLLSVLFYKENYYTGAAHPSYTFETLNFDLIDGSFMEYKDFFKENSEGELREILNQKLQDKINSGEMYYDCWEISEDDFSVLKDNFVIRDDSVEYYFDDCVICPSYTGTYSIKLPMETLAPVVKKNGKNPLANFK